MTRRQEYATLTAIAAAGELRESEIRALIGRTIKHVIRQLRDDKLITRVPGCAPECWDNRDYNHAYKLSAKGHARLRRIEPPTPARRSRRRLRFAQAEMFEGDRDEARS
jgi:hypothetical protein